MLVALLGIVFPMLFGYATGVGFQSSPTEAFFFGIVLAATSVSISVEVLKELNVVNTKERFGDSWCFREWMIFLVVLVFES